MKILGHNGRDYTAPDTFICEISLDEIRKVTNKASYKDWSNDEVKKLLAVGVDYPISEGYDFRGEITAAVRAMTSAYESFSKASQTMAQFAALMAVRDLQDSES